MNKQCSTCKETKDYSRFYKKKASKDGYQSQCKVCADRSSVLAKQKRKDHYREHRQQYYLKNRDVIQRRNKEYRERNRSKINQQKKEYRQSNVDKIRAQDRAYYLNNRENILRYHKQYSIQNKDKRKEYKAQYYLRNKSKYLATSSLRKKRVKKATPPWADLKKIEHVYWVCNFISELTGIQHHVDHIHPLQGDIVCGLHVHTNLQILTATENLSKGNSFNPKNHRGIEQASET